MSNEDVIRFCRLARANGFSAGLTETLGAVEAVRAVNESASKFALRSVLCSSKDEWDAFERLYESFFAEEAASPEPRKRADARGIWMLTGEAGAAKAVEPDREVTGAGVHARLKKMDFSNVPAGDQAELEKLAQRMLARMSWRLSRRLRIGKSRGPIDLRRTIRRSIGRGGEPFNLLFKNRQRLQARVVMLIDISGSMSTYSLFFLRFAHAMVKHFRRAHPFVFSTSLVEIGAALRTRKAADALKRMGGLRADWAGGTKIGESLAELSRMYARLISRDMLLMILSDGWDTGDPGRMAAELKTIRRTARQVIWLNPLLGLEEYRPETEAMAKALPHIDVFAPANSLEHLLQLEIYLTHV